METRTLKKLKKEIVPELSFEEVTVKEEPQDVLYESVEFSAEKTKASTSRKRTKAASSTNTNGNRSFLKAGKQRKIQPITNRSTQVNSEEIDSWNIQKTHEDSVPGENKPIVLIDNEPIVPPQCRFCLRRVSFENLKVISNDHKSKAMVALQLKVFPRDVYPYGCINCLNLLDIFVDFKSSVTKAKRLLLTKRMNLESEGWDDAIVTEAFQQCKGAVEQHRMQIDEVYEKCVELTQSESTLVIAVEKHKTDEDRLQNSVEDVMEVSQTVDLEADQIRHQQSNERFEASIDESNNELIFEMTNESTISEITVEETNESHPEPDFKETEELNSTILQPDNMTQFLVQVKTDDNLPRPSKQRANQSRKVKTATSIKHYKDHELPAGLRVLCDICGKSMYSESLESHKNRHLGIKPYTCPVSGCGFMFYSRANMATHMRRMHAEKGREEHKCDICGKYVRGQPGCLNVHKKRHTNERKYVCHLCGKGFTMTAYLRQHMLSHSVEFPHQCRYCGKKFNNKYSMKTHEKSIHEKNNHTPKS